MPHYASRSGYDCDMYGHCPHQNLTVLYVYINITNLWIITIKTPSSLGSSRQSHLEPQMISVNLWVPDVSRHFIVLCA